MTTESSLLPNILRSFMDYLWNPIFSYLLKNNSPHLCWRNYGHDGNHIVRYFFI